MAGSGYRDDHEAALARIAALEEELRELDARHDRHADDERTRRERVVRDRIDELARGRRRLFYASAVICAGLIVGTVRAIARGDGLRDVASTMLGIVIAALFVHGSRLEDREERRLSKELGTLGATQDDPRRGELGRELEDARAALEAQRNG